MTPKEVDSLWTDLLSADAAIAFASIQKLASAPKVSVAFLRRQWKPALVDGKRLDRFIADLDSGEFQKRSQAAEELSDLGELALHPLKKAQASSPSLEARRRMEPLIERLTPTALTATEVRLVRSVEVLERAATPEAQGTLKALAEGAPGALLTRQARLALDRVISQAKTP